MASAMQLRLRLGQQHEVVGEEQDRHAAGAVRDTAALEAPREHVDEKVEEDRRERAALPHSHRDLHDAGLKIARRRDH
jgi:hypothetical protein